MTTTMDARSTLKFTKMCKHWRSNRCTMGQSCNFAHSAAELRAQPDLVATKLCFQFMSKGRCKKGDECTFAHGRKELRQAPPEEVPVVERPTLKPMKVNLPMPAGTGLKAVVSQLEELTFDALNPFSPMPDALSAFDVLSAFHPPPGLMPPPGLGGYDSYVGGGTGSIPSEHIFAEKLVSPASTSFPCSPRIDDMYGSEPLSDIYGSEPLSPASEVFRL
ncbi:mRNA decay activator protein ZFP36 (Tristetraprolin) (TTP) (Zinc finger protein 36) (Zfp-36) [Durusdinium trenchii]|uniref:mRNA decay activator protein ZFP36 (Tristetraprolin) (TTP) (Zinc finger protein 36) (Zfp-36) n=1 Tax=Durusdinium trenchii TaxID=1381693 RepID=A0ABP0M0N7_9DINO